MRARPVCDDASSAGVVRFPGHRWHRCDSPDCFICVWGIDACTTCGGGGDALPTDCPGERMSFEMERSVHAGRADYREPIGWIVSTPAGKIGDIA